MNQRERWKTVFFYGFFVCYLLLLAKILFLSRLSPWELLDSSREIHRPINLIPFHSILKMLPDHAGDSRFAFGNVIGNILLFMPFGLYIVLLRRDKRVLPNLLLALGVSLFAELIQGVFGIGTADIDDVMLNTLGGWLGIVIYNVLSALFRNEKTVRTVILWPSAILGLPLMYYLMFVMKMRF